MLERNVRLTDQERDY